MDDDLEGADIWGDSNDASGSGSGGGDDANKNDKSAGGGGGGPMTEVVVFCGVGGVAIVSSSCVCVFNSSFALFDTSLGEQKLTTLAKSTSLLVGKAGRRNSTNSRTAMLVL